MIVRADHKTHKIIFPYFNINNLYIQKNLFIYTYIYLFIYLFTNTYLALFLNFLNKFLRQFDCILITSRRGEDDRDGRGQRHISPLFARARHFTDMPPPPPLRRIRVRSDPESEHWVSRGYPEHGANNNHGWWCTTCSTGDAATASPSPTTTAPPRATSPSTITVWCSAPSRSRMTNCSKSPSTRRYPSPRRETPSRTLDSPQPPRAPTSMTERGGHRVRRAVPVRRDASNEPRERHFHLERSRKNNAGIFCTDIVNK